MGVEAGYSDYTDYRAFSPIGGAVIAVIAAICLAKRLSQPRLKRSNVPYRSIFADG